MFSKPPVSTLVATLAFLGLSAPALCHEFWLEPEKYQVESNTDLVIHLRNGEHFKGSSLAYFPKRTMRFDTYMSGGFSPYAGRMGDVPAMAIPVQGEGLLVVLHETTPLTVTYDSWDDFAAFAEHKGFSDIETRHLARGFELTGFEERYTRFAKTLVAIGNGTGADTETGMETEFIALQNPYETGASEVPFQLLYQGRPHPKAQVEVHAKGPDGTASVIKLSTDDQGVVIVPTLPRHQYMLDAVLIRPPSADGSIPWETLWASMTFAVP